MAKNSKIKSIQTREILDSRGSWTVEVGLETSQGLFMGSAPTAASIGKYEAPTVSPEKACQNINKIIAPKLEGKCVVGQRERIDEFLDPEKFGANTTTAVSIAVWRAGAVVQNLPLWKYINQMPERGEAKRGVKMRANSEGGKLHRPYRGRVSASLPKICFNMINGGAHASNELDFQEFMIVCSVQKASDIYQDLRKKIGKNVGDEGGFTPLFKSPKEALELLSQYNVKIIIDVAASQFSERKKKIYNSDYFQNLVVKYPIIGLEDPFGEDDWEGWQKLISNFQFPISNFLVIGDDLLVTNPKRIKMAKEKKACNAAIIKINQIGTVSGAIEAAKLAKSYGWKIMVSHRSGETNDDFIADFAVGIGADFIKAGAPARGERVSKYNRLLKIEQEIYG